MGGDNSSDQGMHCLPFQIEIPFQKGYFIIYKQSNPPTVLLIQLILQIHTFIYREHQSLHKESFLHNFGSKFLVNCSASFIRKGVVVSQEANASEPQAPVWGVIRLKVRVSNTCLDSIKVLLITYYCCTNLFCLQCLFVYFIAIQHYYFLHYTLPSA